MWAFKRLASSPPGPLYPPPSFAQASVLPAASSSPRVPARQSPGGRPRASRRREEGSHRGLAHGALRGFPRGGTWALRGRVEAGPSRRPAPPRWAGPAEAPPPFSRRAESVPPGEKPAVTLRADAAARHRGAGAPFRLGVLWSPRVSCDIPKSRPGSHHGGQGLPLLPHGQEGELQPGGTPVQQSGEGPGGRTSTGTAQGPFVRPSV